MNRHFKILLTILFVLLLAPAAHALESGWYWNPDEDGRGMAVEIQGDFIFVALYHYDESGRPTWVSSGGTMDPDLRYYSGDLQRFENGQVPGGQYHAPDPPEKVGAISLYWTTRDEIALQYTVDGAREEKTYVRFRFAPLTQDGKLTDLNLMKPGLIYWYYNAEEEYYNLALERYKGQLFLYRLTKSGERLTYTIKNATNVDFVAVLSWEGNQYTETPTGVSGRLADDGDRLEVVFSQPSEHVAQMHYGTFSAIQNVGSAD